MLIAITRAVSPTLAECQLTHLPREPIDVAKAMADHASYEAALRAAGASVVHAPPEPALPDAVFVEDTTLVLDEVAVMTRPGAETRRAEVTSMADVVAAYRPLRWIEAPGTLDGGDVMVVDRTIYVGSSARSNRDAIGQLEQIVDPYDYRVTPVPLNGCLHLKSAVTQIGPQLLLINDRWVRSGCFAPLETLTVAPEEPGAANALWISGSVIYPAHYPQTAARLERAGVRVMPVPAAEVAKAEGGVTCCSVVFEAR